MTQREEQMPYIKVKYTKDTARRITAKIDRAELDRLLALTKCPSCSEAAEAQDERGES